MSLAALPDDFTQQDHEHKKLPLRWAARTEVGHVREHNEDSYLLQAPLFAVADGMGGHEAGEVASSIAVTTLAQEAPKHADAAALGAAIEKANLQLIAAAQEGKGRLGMGTTCTAAYIEHNKLALAHVGDSRAYLFHKGTLTRVTHDHSFVEELVESGEISADEARNHPNRSIITRALGSDKDMYADHFELMVEEGDRILLCSDGLSGMLTDHEIEEIMITSPGPDECVFSLVEAALRAGGLDNVTALVIEIANDGARTQLKKSALKNIALWAASVLIAVLLVLGGIYVYAINSWFVIDEGGLVSVYKGIPGGLGPFNLEELQNQTTIKTADLAPSTARRLKDGIKISGRDEVDKLLESYRMQIIEEQRARAEKLPTEEEREEQRAREEELKDEQGSDLGAEAALAGTGLSNGGTNAQGGQPHE